MQMTILLSKRVEYLQENTYIEWRSYELKREIRRPSSAGMTILNEPLVEKWKVYIQKWS